MTLHKNLVLPSTAIFDLMGRHFVLSGILANTRAAEQRDYTDVLRRMMWRDAAEQRDYVDVLRMMTWRDAAEQRDYTDVLRRMMWRDAAEQRDYVDVLRRMTWRDAAESGASASRAAKTRCTWRATASDGSMTTARPSAAASINARKCGKCVQPRTR